MRRRAAARDEVRPSPERTAASEPEIQLPPLLRLDRLARRRRGWWLRSDRIGAAGRTRCSPACTAPRRLQWPGYLAPRLGLLAPLDASGALAAAVEDALEQGRLGRRHRRAARRRRAVLAPALRPRVPGHRALHRRRDTPGWWSSAASCAAPAIGA
jgi:hypothetical protein